MDRLLPTLILVGIVVLAGVGMVHGWRARLRKQSTFPELDQVPDSIGEVLGVAIGLYVATTLSGQPLERVAANKLGFRAKATVTIASGGVVVDAAGRNPFFIARDNVSAATRGTWAIDKAVEPGGLIVITWRLGEISLDSYFRMDAGSTELLEAATELIEGTA